MDTMDSWHSLQRPHLASLPLDVFQQLSLHLDLRSIARLQATCSALRSPNLYSPDWQLLDAFTHTDSAAFALAYARAPQSLTSLVRCQHPNPWLDQDEPELEPCDPTVHVKLLRRRRRLFNAITWHLVALLDHDSDLWWSRASQFHDLTVDCLVLQKAFDTPRTAFTVVTNPLDLESVELFDRIITVAVDRLHLRGIKAFAKLGRSLKASWIQSLDVTELTIQVAQSRPPSLSETDHLDLLVALMILTCFGNDEDERGEFAMDRFWNLVRHPLVVMETMAFLTSGDAHYTLVARTPVFVLYLMHGGHHALSMDLLDLLLLAVGTMPKDPSRPGASHMTGWVDFGDLDPDKLHADLAHRFAGMGVSRALFESTLAGFRSSYSWNRFKDLVLLSDLADVQMHPEVLRWFLDRYPLHLDLIHAFCHSTSAVIPAPLMPLLLQRIPMDLATPDLPPNQACTRCNQLKDLGKCDDAPRTLAHLVAEEVPVLYEPFGFEPDVALDVRSVLHAIPVPNAPKRQSSLHVARGLSPHSILWRSYLTRPRHTRAHLAHVWDHVRTADPATALNVVPFADLVWAYVKASLFDEALRVLQAARAGDNGRVCWSVRQEALAWRWTQDVEDAVDLKRISSKRSGTVVNKEYLALMAYVRDNELDALVGPVGW